MKNNFQNFIDNEQDIIQKFAIANNEEHLLFANLKLAANKLGIKDDEIILSCWEEKEKIKKFSNIIDYYNFLFLKISKENTFKKFAYPNNSADQIIGLYDKRYDIGSWSNIVRKIYTKYYESQGEANYQDLVEKFSKEIKDDEERFKFKLWLKYYNDGNNKKYSSDRNNKKMKKQSSFYLPLAISDSYSSDRNPYVNGVDLAQDGSSSNFNETVDDAKDKAELKTSYKNWKRKFTTAWRRIDKVLKESEDYIDPERYEQISEVLHKLDVQIGKIRLHSTASDLSFNVSKELRKIGFTEGSDILRKFAQEVAPIQPETPPPQTETAAPAEATVPQEKTPEQISAERRMSDRNNETVGGERVKEVPPLPGPTPTEYDKFLPPNISIDDASAKLEQIAGMLSDRRVIRYLAEFDIMLDKIGIASMFPELAEAQSKLIDSYSYGLVRVTKMLGMLSNNKAVLERTVGRGADSLVQPKAEQPSDQPVSQPITPPKV
jgi:hypothetical protein